MFNSLRRGQDGIAHLVIIGVVALIAVGGIGYYVVAGNKDKKASDSSASPQTAATNAANEEACKKEIDDKDFCKFASKFANLTNYTTVIKTSGANGSGEIIIETESADKSRVITKQDGKEVGAFITIGKTYYTKDYDDGKWLKIIGEAPAAADLEEDIGIDFSDDNANGITYKRIGEEACGSLKCLKFQIIDAQEEEPTTQFIWFDTKDYLLRRYSVSGGEGTTDMNLTYGKVTITEPSPTKELPASSGSGIPEDIQAQIDAAMQGAGQ